MSIAEHRRSEKLKDRQILWLRRRGKNFFRDEAAVLGLSPDMVRKVFNGIASSKGLRVERHLASLGAPGFEERRLEADCA